MALDGAREKRGEQLIVASARLLPAAVCVVVAVLLILLRNANEITTGRRPPPPASCKLWRPSFRVLLAAPAWSDLLAVAVAEGPLLAAASIISACTLATRSTLLKNFSFPN
jgi:hypothetical protein